MSYERAQPSPEDQPDWPELPESVESAKEIAVARAQNLVAAHESGDENQVEQARAELGRTLDDIQELAGVDAMLKHLSFLTENHLSNS